MLAAAVAAVDTVDLVGDARLRAATITTGLVIATEGVYNGGSWFGVAHRLHSTARSLDSATDVDGIRERQVVGTVERESPYVNMIRSRIPLACRNHRFERAGGASQQTS